MKNKAASRRFHKIVKRFQSYSNSEFAEEWARLFSSWLQEIKRSSPILQRHTIGGKPTTVSVILKRAETLLTECNRVEEYREELLFLKWEAMKIFAKNLERRSM